MKVCIVASEVLGWGVAGGFGFAGMSHKGSVVALPSGIYAWNADPAALIPADCAMVIAENWSADVGFQLTQRAAKDLADGRSYFVDITKPDDLLPTYNGEGVYVVINSLGIAGVGAGLHVVMVDPPSLGDPIGSRLVLAPDAQYRVGHAYKPVVWAMARYTASDVHPDDQALNDARATLACGDVPTLISAISEPLTVQRFFANITLAPKLTLLRIPVDPAEARATLC